jgi:hypothetical protein
MEDVPMIQTSTFVGNSILLNGEEDIQYLSEFILQLNFKIVYKKKLIEIAD